FAQGLKDLEALKEPVYHPRKHTNNNENIGKRQNPASAIQLRGEGWHGGLEAESDSRGHQARGSLFHRAQRTSRRRAHRRFAGPIEDTVVGRAVVPHISGRCRIPGRHDPRRPEEGGTRRTTIARRMNEPFSLRPVRVNFQWYLAFAASWALSQERLILKKGIPLTTAQLNDARLAGVAYPQRVRLLVVEQIPLPAQPELR